MQIEANLKFKQNFFSQIRCDFLPVGHTHEDIDAFFGVLAQFIRMRDAYYIEGMIKTKASFACKLI